MKEFVLSSDDVVSGVMDARNRREDFAVVAKGSRARRLYKAVPYYERYRAAYREESPGRLRHLLLFAPRGLLAPTFWGACILAGFEAKDSKFVLQDDVLRAEFYF